MQKEIKGLKQIVKCDGVRIEVVFNENLTMITTSQLVNPDSKYLDYDLSRVFKDKLYIRKRTTFKTSTVLVISNVVEIGLRTMASVQASITEVE